MVVGFQAVVGSIVLAFRRLKKPKCWEMSACGYALYSVCHQLSISSPLTGQSFLHDKPSLDLLSFTGYLSFTGSNVSSVLCCVNDVKIPIIQASPYTTPLRCLRLGQQNVSVSKWWSRVWEIPRIQHELVKVNNYGMVSDFSVHVTQISYTQTTGKRGVPP